MEILFHDDNPIIEAKSSVEQFNGVFSAVRGGVNVPIESDQIDYIDCDRIVSHPILIESDRQEDYFYPDGHFVASKEGVLAGDSGDKREILFHDDDPQVVNESSVSQFDDWLTIRDGGVEVPIEFDRINYINCETINSDKILVRSDSADDFIFPDGHRVVANTRISGDAGEKASLLFHDDGGTVRQYSSIDQFNDFLSIEKGGVRVPIEFEMIDYIDCGRVVSHPVIIDNGNHIGYYYPDAYVADVETEYPMFDYERTELRELPEYMGSGFYEAHDTGLEIVNDDRGRALGVRNENMLRIGQNYFLADEILPADDAE